MATPPSTAIGIDLGRHSIKAVALQRKSTGQLCLTHLASHLMDPAAPPTVESLAQHLKTVLQQLGTRTKACGIAISHPDLLVRIVEQPETPREVLRDAIRFNSQSLLNHDCKDYVLDCDLIAASAPASAAPDKPAQRRYLVVGLPRPLVSVVYDACQKIKLPPTTLTASSVAACNAFEFSNEATFFHQAFVLVDVGHHSTTVMVGAKKELILVRTLDYGSHHFIHELLSQAGGDPVSVLRQLMAHDPQISETARLSLTELVRAVNSSIGFVEARREEIIPRVYAHGGLFKTAAVSELLTEELQLPCEIWNPFAQCEINVSTAQRPILEAELPTLGAAFGVAAGILKP